jgi:hypothetical protein
VYTTVFSVDTTVFSPVDGDRVRKMGCAVHFYCFHTYHAKDIKKEKADWTNARKSMFIEIMLELV